MAELSSTPGANLANSQYPTIEPTSFDLIVSGTGLPESILAAAAAAAGKSVLHVDPNSFYGSHFSSVSLTSHVSFLLGNPSVYSSISSSGDPLELQSGNSKGGGFLIDLHGPRLLYCADPMVDLLIRSGGSHHVEFKSVDASLVWWDGRLAPVPDSRQAIFKDRTLALAEKSQMMRFLKLVQEHIGPAKEDAEGMKRISDEEMELPFVEFLEKQRLPPKIRSIILYAIALADFDQENRETCKKLIKTKEGIEIIALYTSSIGRFSNAVGAFIYPMYGHGELPQAFCRCAAVKGALYILRMPVISPLIDKESGQYKGVKLASGQDVFSPKLIMDPSLSSSMVPTPTRCEGLTASDIAARVARGICITNRSIQSGLSNILVVFPPRSLHSEQFTSLRALQLSGNVAVCPQELFVVYLSTPCDDGIVGKECIQAAMNALFMQRSLNCSEGSTSLDNGDAESKPTLLWSCVYVQELSQASIDGMSSCPMPDANLDYRDLLDSTIKLFSSLFPGEEFFPKTPASEHDDEESGFSD